ncbi:MAG: DeoR/GlpR family DNA-binding transcription regulator [Nocardioidaceae bacterium]
MTDQHQLSRSQRWRALLGLLAERGSLSVTDAATQLGASAATIRRDFTSLEEQQLATRTHGGVVATAVAYELPARYRAAGDQPTKERVAAAAARQVSAGAVVGLNGGTTTTACARHLAARTDLTSNDPLTVVTNALNIATAMVLRPHVRTLCIGGVARPESYELHGPFASRFLADLRLDVLLLGVDALTVDNGAMCRHLGEAGINSEMVSRAGRVVVVATSEKLDRTALSQICPVASVQALVTDSDAAPEHLDAFKGAGIEVILA